MTRMATRARLILLAALITATVGCDRVTKHMAEVSLAGLPAKSFLGNTIRLEYAQNTGGFLSIGASLGSSGRVAIFSVLTGSLLLALLVALLRRNWPTWDFVGLTFAFAGGVGNLLDRLAHGVVVDFLNLGIGGLRTGIFNVADVAILAGVLMLISPLSRRTKLI